MFIVAGRTVGVVAALLIAAFGALSGGEPQTADGVSASLPCHAAAAPLAQARTAPANAAAG